MIFGIKKSSCFGYTHTHTHTLKNTHLCKQLLFQFPAFFCSPLSFSSFSLFLSRILSLSLSHSLFLAVVLFRGRCLLFILPAGLNDLSEVILWRMHQTTPSPPPPHPACLRWASLGPV